MAKKNKSSDPFRADRERNDKLNKDKSHEDKLPGDYPPEEDIMNRGDIDRIGIDVENYSKSVSQQISSNPLDITTLEPIVVAQDVTPLRTGEEAVVNNLENILANDMEKPVPEDLEADDSLEFVTGNESDVTKEDLEALGPKDLSMDMGEDEELLKHRVYPVDMAGGDLDLPDDDDVNNNDTGAEDEENGLYSLGSDNLEDNMEGE